MPQSQNIKVFDWERIVFSDDLPLTYLGEIAFRTVVMFLILIIALKFLSKRGVKQLSVFELAILIGLGSAVGDPMFYNHIPVLHGITVLVIVIWLYRLITGFTARSKFIEELLEGKPTLLVHNGKIVFENYRKVGLPYDKFFAELRLKSIDHLGQVRKAYLETSGEISVYYFEDRDVQPGLPIYPENIDNPIEKSNEENQFACIYCGEVAIIKIEKESKCPVCKNNEWLIAASVKRIS